MIATTALRRRAALHLPALVPGLLAIGLFILWAVHNGGYDEDTWYWGALAMLALCAVTLIALRSSRRPLTVIHRIALGLFALYVAWSYASMLWASDKGAALQGSNRALLFLLTFALLSMLPWTETSALIALVTFVVGIGTIAVALIVRLAQADHVGALFQEGRLSAPTGYFNATAALFTMAALSGVALSVRRELPGPLRGLLLALATADLDLALAVQSRGWLFTLPLVALLAIVVAGRRLRVTGAAVLVGAGVLLTARRWLHVYQNTPSDPLSRLATHAARPALLVLAGVFFVATLIAWIDGLDRVPALARRWSVALGTLIALGGVGAVVGALLVVSKGSPGAFISRQWHGFAHEPTSAADFTNSHFTDIGSGRYDFWRVAIDAFRHHPIGGLGQDNFADYYMLHRHTTEQPTWTHSLELRLLASTGIVGALLFGLFVILAVVVAMRARRRGGGLQQAVIGAAVMPLIVWVVHGSIDWFWEVPALSGPALGLLGIGCALSTVPATSPDGVAGDGAEPALPEGRTAPPGRPLAVRVCGWTSIAVGVVAATVVLGLPYLSVRETSIASNIEGSNPTAALARLRTAEKLNPLQSDPAQLAGTIAIVNGEPQVAYDSFRRSIHRDPGGWFSWLGAGLASSALGHPRRAGRELSVANHIDHGDPAIQTALARVNTPHPISPIADLNLLPALQ